MNKTALSIIAAGFIIGAAFMFSGKTTGPSETASVNNVSVVDGTQIIEIDARGGYEPRNTVAKAGVPTIIRMSTSGTFDCSSAVRIPSLGISKNLSPSGSVDIPIGVQNESTLQGTCSMGMYNFAINFQK